VTELPELLVRSVRPVPVARPVLRVTREPTEIPAPREPMAKQVRMGRLACAALLARQGPKAPQALTEPKGRKVGREIARSHSRSGPHASWVAITEHHRNPQYDVDIAKTFGGASRLDARGL